MFLLFIIFIIHLNGFKQFEIEFQIDDNTLSQTVYLTNSTNDVRLATLSNEFQLKTDSNLTYLTFINQKQIKCTQNNQLSLLDSNETINVQITNRNCANHLDLRLNIEYLFKLSNESESGLIKYDMTANGIIAIIRTNSTNSTDLLINTIKSNEQHLDYKYFMLKKFMPNHYMLRLTDHTKSLHKLVNETDIEISLISDLKEIISTRQLKFKLISAKSLELKFSDESIKEGKIDLKITEDYGTDCLQNQYGGAHLYNAKITIDSNLFENKLDQYNYIEKNIRFSIMNSNTNIIEIDPINGNLNIKPNQCLDREQITAINATIAVQDIRKLFKQIILNINIQLEDLNDNRPQFKQSIYNLKLTPNRTDSIKDILIFDEQAIDLDDNQTLQYEILTALSLYKSKQISVVQLFQIQSNKLYVSNKIFERLEKFYTVRLLCKDDGDPIMFTTATLNIMIESSSQLVKSFQYIVNLDLIKPNFKIASFELSDFQPVKFLSSNQQLDLVLNLNKSLIISKTALFNAIDKYSFVQFEHQNSQLKLTIWIKFTTNDKYQFSQNKYEFQINEDSDSQIGLLETNCPQISQIQIDSNLIKTEIKQNQIRLISIGEFNYELEPKHTIQIYSICANNYLITTNITIDLIDSNDNEPIFMNPLFTSQTFQAVVTQSDTVLITNLKAIDLDTTAEYAKIDFKIKQLSTNLNYSFYLNGTSLFFKLNFYSINFIRDDIEITAFNIKSSSKSVINIKIAIYSAKPNNKLIETKFNNLIEFNSVAGDSMIRKCWLRIDFKQVEATNQFYLNLKQSSFYLYKRNGYLNTTGQQIDIECQAGDSTIIKLGIYFAKEPLEFKSINKIIHYKLNRNDLLANDNLVKIDQLFDLNIPLNYFIVYSLQKDDLNCFQINSFTGQLSKTSQIVDQIIQHSDLIKITLKASDLINRYEKSSVTLYLHLTSEEQTAFSSLAQLDQIETSLNNKMFKISIQSLKQKYFVRLASNSFNCSIQNVLELDLIDNNEIVYNYPLFNIEQNDLVLNIQHLKADQTVSFYQVYINVCQLKIDTCKQISFVIETRIDLNVNEISFVNDESVFYFNWDSISFNVALLNLNHLITQNFTFANHFKIDSNLITEQLGLLYLKPTTNFMKQLEFIATLNDRINTTVKFIFNPMLNEYKVTIQLEDSNDVAHLIKLNQTNGEINMICINVDQLSCDAIFELSNYNLFINQLEAKKHFSQFVQIEPTKRQIEILLKVNKKNVAIVIIDVSLSTQPIESIQTFSHIDQIVNLIEINEKKAMFQFKPTQQLELIRVKNLITNNEVLALDYQFKNSYLKLNDLKSLELNQIYSFDFNSSSSYQSSMFAVRLNNLNIDKMNKFVTFHCDDTLAKQLILNLSKLEDENPTNVFTQKIYLINRYSNIKIENFKITSDRFYLLNNDLDCSDRLTSASSIQILKFYIDKISLRIKKIIEINLNFEILTTRPVIKLDTFYKLVTMTKSSLIDDVLVYDFNATDLEFQIDYTNLSLPFEIEQFSGRINYLPSEDQLQFDSNGEKCFRFNVLIVSAHTSTKFTFEFILIDDDPLILINKNSLNAKFYMNSSISSTLIGRFDLTNLVEDQKLKLFFQSNKQVLNFKIEDKITFFHLDKLTGALFIKNSVDELQSDFYAVNIKCNGTIGHRLVLITIKCLIIVNKDFNMKQLDNFKDEFSFYFDNSTKKIGNINQNNDTNLETRFKILNTNKCEINWLNGDIYCLSKFKSIILSILVAYKHNSNIQFANLVKVNLMSTINTIKPETSSNQLNLSLKIQPSYNPIQLTIQNEFNLDNHRFIFAPNQNESNKISTYFSLNQYSAQLEQYRSVEHNQLKEKIQVIQLLNDNKFKIVKLINLELNICEVEMNSRELAFNVNHFKEVKLSNIDPQSQYYLSEDYIQNEFQPDKIEFNNQLKVFLNNTGIWIDKKQLNISAAIFNFYLIELNSSKRIHFKLNLCNELDSKTDNKTFRIEKFIDFKTIKLNDEIIALNEFESSVHNIKLSSSNSAFEINPLNNSLIITQLNSLNSTYEFVIFINDNIVIEVKIVLQDYNGLIFDNYLYQIEINSLTNNFNFINAIYLNQTIDSNKQVVYQFSESNSLITVNRQTGEIELNKWNSYQDYCNQKHNSPLIYTVKAIDELKQFETTSLIKLNIKCSLFKFQFEQYQYYKQITDDIQLNSSIIKINIKTTLNSTKINYYFCDLKLNSALFNPFAIDQQTGDVYLNSQLTNRLNYSFVICAHIESINQIIETNLLITIQTNIKFEFDLFNIQNDPIELEIPLTSNESIRLFQLNAISSSNMRYNLETINPNIFELSQTGWLSLHSDQVLNNGEFQLKITTSDQSNKRHKEFKLQIFKLQNKINIDLNQDEKHLDLKNIYENNYKFIVIEPNPIVSYNSSNGFIYLKTSNLKTQIQFDLKLISLQSDLIIGSVRVSPTNNKIKFESDLFISKYSQLNSTIYSINDQMDRINEVISEEKLFTFNKKHVLLNQSLTNQLVDKIVLYLNTTYQSIALNVYIIENLINNLQFKQLNYYFKHSISNDYIGKIELNSNYDLLVKLNQNRLNSIRIIKSSCLATKATIDSIFYLNQMEIFINRSLVQNCDLYQLTIEAELNDKTLSTEIFIEITNILSKNLYLASYSIEVDRLDFSKNGWKSINLFDLIKNKVTSLILCASLVNDNNLIEFNFNSLDGILSINIGVDKMAKVLNFKITALVQTREDFHLVQQFELNILVNQKESQSFFKHKIVEVELNYPQMNRLYNDNVMLLDLSKLVFNSKENLNISIVTEQKLLHLNDNKLYFNSNFESQNQRYYFTFTRLVPVNLCILSQCDQLIISFQFNVINREQIDLIDEYYSLINKQLTIRTNSNLKTINLKLRAFNRAVFSSDDKIFQINDLTNVISANISQIANTNKLDLKYNNKVISFDLNIIEATNRFITTEINIDLFYLGDKQVNISLGELIQSNCELWNEQLPFLRIINKCQLIINLNPMNYSDKYQLKFQLRAFDLKSINRSIFYLVKINMVKINFNKKKFLLVILNNKQKLTSLNKLIKSKLNCYLINEKQQENQLVLIRPIDGDFNSGLIFKVSKLFETMFGLENYELLTASSKQSCSDSKLIFESYTTNEVYYFYGSQFELQYRKIIDLNQYGLIAPILEHQFNTKNALNSPDIKNLIKFQPLSYLVYDASRLTIDKLTLRFLFKLNSVNSFLFNIKVLSTDFSFQINNSKLELHRLDIIQFDQFIELNDWYQFEMELHETIITIKLRKYFQSMFNCQIDSQIETRLITTNQTNLNFEQLSIGGSLKSSQNFLHFYSDNLSLADFELNNYDLLDLDTIRKLSTKVLIPNNQQFSNCPFNIQSSDCNSALGSFKSFLNGKTAKLRIQMNNNHKEFISFYNKTFDVSIKFKLNVTRAFNETILLRTRNSVLLINSTRLEFKTANKLNAWININDLFNQNNTFKLKLIKIKDDLKITLNDEFKTFLFETSAYEFISSEFIEISNQELTKPTNDYVLFEEITINNNRIALWNGISKDYETKFLLIDSKATECCLIPIIKTEKVTFKESESIDNSLVNVVIISTTIMSIAVLVGIFVLIFSYLNIKFKSNITTNDKTIINDLSKFNSRNKLEISLNSDQNSVNLDESPMSSFSRETPSALLNKFNETMNTSGCVSPLTLHKQRSYKSLIRPVNEKQQIFQNNQFDFSLLNWMPSFNEFKYVINEFEQFSCNNTNKSNENNVIYHETDQTQIEQDFIKNNNFLNDFKSSNNCDRQTFV